MAAGIQSQLYHWQIAYLGKGQRLHVNAIGGVHTFWAGVCNHDHNSIVIMWIVVAWILQHSKQKIQCMLEGMLRNQYNLLNGWIQILLTAAARMLHAHTGPPGTQRTSKHCLHTASPLAAHEK